MIEFFTSGHVVDVILGLMLLEGMALAVYHIKTGRGLTPVDLLGNLLAGTFLLLALRTALVQAWWGWIALCLTAALLAHLADLRRRWRRRQQTSG